MQNRRRFLFQTSMATASLAFLRPLKSVALTSAKVSISNAANRISIIDIGCIHPDVDTSKINLPALKTLQESLQKDNCHLLLLGNGNLLQAESSTRNQHLKQLSALHRIGLDTILPGQSDLIKGEGYNNSLLAECNLPTFRSNDKDGISNKLLPFQIIKKGKIKVGIIGNDNFEKQTVESNELADLATRVNSTAAYLTEKGGCNFVLLIRNERDEQNKSNSNFDITLAGMTKNVNMIASSCEVSKNCDSYIAHNLNAEEVFISFATDDRSPGSRFEITFNDNMEKINANVYAIA